MKIALNDGFQEGKHLHKRESSEIALLLGNGINRSAGASGGLSWDRLMEMLITKVSSTALAPADTEKRLKRLIQPGANGQTPASLPEAFDIIDATRTPSDTKFRLAGKINLQRTIVPLLKDMKPGLPHKAVVNWATHFHVPLLTTNYDHCFQDALDKPSCRRRKFGSRPLRSDVYPWDRYYAPMEIADPAQDFAIWHIHGDRDLERSIRVGLDQYMGMVERLRKWKLPVAKEALSRSTDSQATPAFHAAPWLRAFMGKKLWIQGLGLSAAEVSIRWLLIQRFRYWKRFKSEDHFPSGWYVHAPAPENRRLDTERRIFFESVGLKVITITKADDAYLNLFET
jgi:hypothetical protein